MDRLFAKHMQRVSQLNKLEYLITIHSIVVLIQISPNVNINNLQLITIL